jgi:hypothetical protein
VAQYIAEMPGRSGRYRDPSPIVSLVGRSRRKSFGST